MQFRVLGPFELVERGYELTPTAPKLRQVLALLVLRNNHVVQIRELVDELWGDDPPSSALSTLQTYIYKLRKILTEHEHGARDMLRTKPYGYQVSIPSASIDLCRFEKLVEEGQRAMASDPARAAAVLAEALELWRGPALADVTAGDVLSAQLTRLEETRLSVLDLRMEAELRLGAHKSLISELKALTVTYPMHEAFHAKLMIALYRAGRRGEALESYQRIRRNLIDELGLEPSPDLVRVHMAILASDPTLDTPTSEIQVPTPRAAAEIVPPPAQLPPDIGDLVGRAQVNAQVERWLTAAVDSDTAVPMLVLTGPAGVGKTVTAVHIAHRVRSHFPGGQLYASLRDHDGEPINPSLILTDFLHAIGVPDRDIPSTLDERAKVFRTWSADRRVLIVLDDAASAGQVLPLLPGGSRCAVLVTSQAGLYGLAGARVVELDPLRQDEAVDLVAAVVGRTRVEHELHATEQLIELCDRLPLALRSVAARLAAARGLPIAKMVAQLATSRSRLEELRFGELDLRSRFEAHYRRLSDRDRGVFRLLSLVPSATFTTAQVSDLIGLGPDETDVILMRLVEHHLLRIAPTDSTDQICYAFHELARHYAKERLDVVLAEREPASPAPPASPGPEAPWMDAAPPGLPFELTVLSHSVDDALNHCPDGATDTEV
ncbi:MAG TPA: BTAD domain-containing putative transcriptional regulator [Micromonosporaceae bacterium]